MDGRQRTSGCGNIQEISRIYVFYKAVGKPAAFYLSPESENVTKSSHKLIKNCVIVLVCIAIY